MYPPPPSSVIESFVNKSVESISFGQYIIQLYFKEHISLSIEAPFRFGSIGELDQQQVNEFPLQETKLIRIVGSKVLSADCDFNGTLRLSFDNASRDLLIVYGNNPQFEAYTINLNGQIHVV